MFDRTEHYTDSFEREAIDKAGRKSSAIFILDDSGVVVSASPEAVPAMAPGVGDVVGTSLADIVKPLKPVLDQALANPGLSPLEGTFRHRRDANSTPKSVRYRLSPLTDDGGRITGYSIQFTDLDRERMLVGSLKIIREIAARAAESSNINSLLNFALGRVCALINADCGAVHLMEQDSGKGRLTAMCRLPDEMIPALDQIDKDEMPFRLAASTGAQYAVRDFQELTDPGRLMIEHGFRSGIIMPLNLAREQMPPKLLGTITILWTSGHAFDADAMELMEIIASQVALSLANLQIAIERERALSEKDRAARTLEALLNESSEGILWLRNRKAIYANPAFLKMMGGDGQDIIGRDFLDMVGGDDRALLAQCWDDQGRETRFPAELMFVMLGQGGEKLTVEASFSSVEARSGTPLVQLSARDVTRRVQLENMRRASEKKYRLMVEIAHQGIISIDKDGKITLANKRASEIVGYSPSELTELHIGDIVSPEFAPLVAELFMGLESQKVEQQEIGFLSKTGKTVDCVVNAGPILDDMGRVEGHSLFINDLSETKSLREQLYSAEKMTAIGRLAGGIAHEFNNIHAAIQGNTELLMKQPHLVDQDIEDLSAIRNLIRRASHITQQLLIFARRDPPRKEWCDPAEIVESNINLVKKEYATEGIEVRFEKPAPLPPQNMDPGLIGQLLMILIINARDAILQKGGEKRIAVGVGRGQGHIEISVADTGVGLSKEEIKKVFDPFYTTKGALGGSAVPGTGLGLSVAQAIARDHQGTIEIESEPGEGATFIARFPLSAERVENGTSTRSTAFGHVAVGAKVLVVDDEKDVTDMLQRALGLAGYIVEVALTGKDALNKLNNEKFDLVLVDLQIPDMSGEQILEKILDMPLIARPTPVIVTGKTGLGSAEEYGRLGVSMMIRKPFNMHSLFATVYAAVRGDDGGAG